MAKKYLERADVNTDEHLELTRAVIRTIDRGLLKAKHNALNEREKFLISGILMGSLHADAVNLGKIIMPRNLDTKQ